MKKISPACSNTEVSPYGNEWRPGNFSDFIKESKHIISLCSGENPFPLFRGHANHSWKLDSTFVRNSIKHIFGFRNYQNLPEKVRCSIAFHKAINSLLLFNFGTLSWPTQELFDREKTKGHDPWFELMKNMQQYPEKYPNILKGTFLIDWTEDINVALYFANENRTGHGSVWISDAVAMGKIRQVKKVREILDLMNTTDFFESSKTTPLMFHPQKQTGQARAVRQKAIYLAQMDFSRDLADIWVPNEQQFDRERVVINLHLPYGTQKECDEYLNNQSPPITRKYLFPD